MQSPAPNFAILADDGIEPIDIGATYGVLSMAYGLRLMADDGFADCPPADVLMILGRAGLAGSVLIVRKSS